MPAIPNTRIRAELSEKLSKILKDGARPKSSDLLKAYATFSAMGEHSSEQLIESYADLIKSQQYPLSDILHISCSSTIEDFEEAYRAFRQYTDEEFLRFIVSDLITDIPELLFLFKSVLSSDILRLTHVVLQLRLLMFGSDGTKVDAAIYQDSGALPDNPALLRLYRGYQEQNKDIALTQAQFERFYSCINLFPVNSEELSIKAIGYGAVTGLHMALTVGTELIVIPQFSVNIFAELVKKHKPNNIVCVPSMFNSVMNSALMRGENLSFLKRLIFGGDKLCPTTKNR